jgi:CBS domain-containing protein
MKVKDIMTSDVKCCCLDTNLAAAAKIMWEDDCGAVPVTDNQGKVVGVITDRDICIAAATRSRAQWEIRVQDVISKTLHACTPGEEVRAALATMKLQKVRRLPVLGNDGRPVGIVSINDIVLHASTSGKGTEIRAEDVLEALKSIGAHSTTHVAAHA